ncbi:MAG: hypothetical protein DRG78_16395 [Epsilonproteobacteria bacterium]|nr:MAG: hypothetical protein DRG78_16395 [Campylobacterota bacterium]
MRFILFFILLYTSAFSLDKISLQLHWKHQFQFAGYYMAKEKGFYKEFGLDVNIKEYQNNTDALDEVIKESVEYAIGRSSLIIDQAKGSDIKLLLAAFQSSPQVFISSKKSNITKIEDFKSKKIMLTPDMSNIVSLRAITNKVGINIADMHIIPHSFNIDDISNNKTDLMLAYISNEPFLLKEKGVDINIFNPSDYGFDFYSDILFTSAHEIQSHSSRAIDFRDASLRGWKYAFENIEETVELILTKYNTQNKSKKALLFEARELKKLAYHKTKTLGKIDKSKIQRIYDMYNVMGFVDKKIDIDSLVFEEDSMDLTNLEKYYLEKKKVITMCVDPNWLPFEKIQDSKHIGISADYFKIFREKLGVDIELVPTKSWMQSLEYAQQRKCDILSLAMQTPSRKEYMNFTQPYIKTPLVIATKIDAPFVNDFSSIKGKKVGITKGYSSIELIRKNHPEINIVEVENIQDGLDKVTHNEIFGYIGTLAGIGAIFQQNYMGELKIAGKFDLFWELGIGVRDDDEVLLRIFEKLIQGIDTKTQQSIMNHWVAIKYEKGVDYTLILNILLAVVVVLVFILYRHYLLKKSNKELEQLATTDHMTKLHNRRYFSETTEYILALARRNDTQMSALLLDIDKFKNVNDTYGHKVGDDVIILLANLLRKMTRESDIVCRYGGEEFAIFLPRTDIVGAKEIAEKIRKAVEKLSVEIEDKNSIKFTISIGVSEVKANEEYSIEATMNRADQALYEAKEHGRNKVVSHI